MIVVVSLEIMKQFHLKHYLVPNWPQPKNVHAYTSLRMGGHSQPPFASFNLGARAGDDPIAVQANRRQLCRELGLAREPFWLQQEHTNRAVLADNFDLASQPIADAAFTTQPNLACAVLTADCVPILVCDRDGTMVAAIHAGWKGIAIGIIESALQAMKIEGNRLMAWLGPAIGPNAFEVGTEVREMFVKLDVNSASAFKQQSQDFWLADIYWLARLRLQALGITAIYGGEYCTFTDSEHFFSYRRDGVKSGRMASLIWLAKLA